VLLAPAEAIRKKVAVAINGNRRKEQQPDFVWPAKTRQLYS